MAFFGHGVASARRYGGGAPSVDAKATRLRRTVVTSDRFLRMPFLTSFIYS